MMSSNQDHQPAQLRKLLDMLRIQVQGLTRENKKLFDLVNNHVIHPNPLITEFFPDPNSDTVHETKDDLLAALLIWAIDNGYAEAVAPDGQWDFTDPEQSGHLLTCGIF